MAKKLVFETLDQRLLAAVLYRQILDFDTLEIGDQVVVTIEARVEYD